MINTVSFVSEFCPEMKKLLGRVMHSIARIDNGVATSTDDQMPTLLDYQQSVGSGTGVVHAPFDLDGELGNKNMSASQIQEKYLLAFQRMQFLSNAENLPDGANHFTDESVMQLALSMEVFSRATAVLRSSTRATQVFGDLCGINLNRELLLGLEITEQDPLHQIVGSLSDYNPRIVKYVKVEEVSLDAINVDSSLEAVPKVRQGPNGQATGSNTRNSVPGRHSSLGERSRSCGHE